MKIEKKKMITEKALNRWKKEALKKNYPKKITVPDLDRWITMERRIIRMVEELLYIHLRRTKKILEKYEGKVIGEC